MTTVRSSRERSSTVRGSPMLILGCTGAFAAWWRLDVGPPVGLPAHRRRPDADRERALRALLLVIALRVIHFGFGVRPRARDRRGSATGLDDGKPCAVGEVEIGRASCM